MKRCYSIKEAKGWRKRQKKQRKQDIMLKYQSAEYSGRVSTSSVSMSSGKSGMPFIEENMVAYPNSFTTMGECAKITIVEKTATKGVFEVSVRDRIRGVLYSRRVGVQGVMQHIFQDIQTGHHRLYVSESTAKHGKSPSFARDEEPGKPAYYGKPGYVEFSDGVSALMSALERLLGVELDARHAPVNEKTGVQSNMPTLEEIVNKQSNSKGKTHCVNGTGSFESGMQTTEQGGAKLPSNKDMVARFRASAERNLQLAEEALEENNPVEAETRFEYAAGYEQRASKIQGVLCDRMAMLREKRMQKRVDNS